MRVLFVFRDSASGIEKAPFIQSQADSLRKQGIDILIFPVSGAGISSYLKYSRKLSVFLRKNPVDLIHAHYSLCGLTAVLSFPGKPIILSLMGSDALGEYITPEKISMRSKVVVLLTLLVQPFINKIIVKSDNIFQHVNVKRKAVIIPNGVNLDLFKPDTNKNRARARLGLKKDDCLVLYLNNPDHAWKNFALAQGSFTRAGIENARLLTPYPVSQEKLVDYYAAADLLLMTSNMEGSSNVIKEAMACNCPIVSTRVGDVERITKGVQGCYLTSFDPVDVAEKIRLAARFAKENGRTRGRERIQELGLDSETIAGRIVKVYEESRLTNTQR